MTDLSKFFTPDDILEVATSLAGGPFKGHFVSIDNDYLLLCDPDGRKSVIPSEQISYITSSKLPGSHAPASTEAASGESTEADGSPQHIMGSGISESLLSVTDAGVEGTLRVPTLKVIGKLDVDEVNRRNARRKTSKESFSYRAPKYVDPLEKIYTKPMGTVKSTGPKFNVVTLPDGTETTCQSFFTIGNIYPGDEVTFVFYDYHNPKTNEVRKQVRSMMRTGSVASIIATMEDKRFDPRKKGMIADLTSILKDQFADNDLVMEAIQEAGFENLRPRFNSSFNNYSSRPRYRDYDSFGFSETSDFSEPSETSELSENFALENSESSALSEPSELPETSELSEDSASAPEPIQ